MSEREGNKNENRYKKKNVFWMWLQSIKEIIEKDQNRWVR